MMRATVLCALMGAAAANVVFSRTVTHILEGASGTVTLNSGCTGKDQYGSNDCTLDWGKNYTATVDAQLPREIGEGAKLDVDLKVEGIFPLKFTCAACGAVCEFEVPIVKQKVSIQLPPCPLVGAGHYVNSTVLPMPAESPAPISASAKGTATVTDKDGTLMLALDINAKLSK